MVARLQVTHAAGYVIPRDCFRWYARFASCPPASDSCLDSGLRVPYIQDVREEGGTFYHRSVDEFCGGRRVSDEHAGSAVYPPRRGHAVVARELGRSELQ